MSLYGYVRNNPDSYVDPTGESAAIFLNNPAALLPALNPATLVPAIIIVGGAAVVLYVWGDNIEAWFGQPPLPPFRNILGSLGRIWDKTKCLIFLVVAPTEKALDILDALQAETWQDVVEIIITSGMPNWLIRPLKKLIDKAADAIKRWRSPKGSPMPRGPPDGPDAAPPASGSGGGGGGGGGRGGAGGSGRGGGRSPDDGPPKGPDDAPPGSPDLAKAIVAQNGTRVIGFVPHGIDRAIGDAAKRADTRPQAILDALKHPQNIVSGTDPQGRPFQIFTGQNARVVVNPKTGRIVSVNPLSKIGAQ